ncbi:peptidoglycan DD-metalloendopeptidase family protein [Porticoccaceae bacterium]|nr:peptidoglycan DD-metalloendopeptidase family protein [Porticoccaceae bacterium]
MARNIQQKQHWLFDVLSPLKILSCILCLMLLSACSNYAAPVSNRAQPPSIRITTHQVAAGESLYSIAWRYDLNFRLLARANGLSAPYSLRPGQRLTLKTTGISLNNRPASSSSAVVKATKIPSTVVSSGAVKAPIPFKKKPKPEVFSKNWQWKWPIQGKTVETFSPANLRKGVRIKGVSRSMVRPAAPGIVVYAGDGLRGYGKLVIIKHSEILLSAYGHNEKILVKEGQNVKQTEIIAKLGSKGTLYFEIRKDGYPVNPSLYIK